MVVGLLARKPAALPDSILVVTVGQEEEEGSFGFLQAEGRVGRRDGRADRAGRQHRRRGVGGAAGGGAVRRSATRTP